MVAIVAAAGTAGVRRDAERLHPVPVPIDVLSLLAYADNAYY